MIQAYDKLVSENQYEKINRDTGYVTKNEAKTLHKLAQNRREWKDEVVYHKDEENWKYEERMRR